MQRASIVILAVSLGAFLGLAWMLSWLCDDAFILFRYGRNLADGLGLRYNVDVEPPVEGYTQLGWALWMALCERLGRDPTLWSRLSTVLCGAVLLGYVVHFARIRMGLATLGTAAAALFFATSPVVSVWSTGGLGTMAFALVVFAVFERLLGDAGHPRGLQAGALAATAEVLRADAIYFVGAIVAIALARGWIERDRRLRRQALIVGAIFAATLAAHELWRLGYHGDWLPNTVRAKVGIGLASLRRGTCYVASLWLVIPAILVVTLASIPRALRGGDAAVRSCWALALATFLYGVLVGGDFMPMGRFLLPAIPPLALLAGRLVQDAARRTSPAIGAGLVGILLVGSLPASFDVHLVPLSLRERLYFRWGQPDYQTELGAWRWTRKMSRHRSNLGRAIALHCDPSESLVVGSIGAVGYYSNLIILDDRGLVDREVAASRDARIDRPTTAGHDRWVRPRFFRDRHPTYVAVQLLYDDLVPGVETLPAKVSGYDAVEVFRVTRSEGFPKDGHLYLVRYTDRQPPPRPGSDGH